MGGRRTGRTRSCAPRLMQCAVLRCAVRRRAWLGGCQGPADRSPPRPPSSCTPHRHPPKVTRVEVSLNDGESWLNADVKCTETPNAYGGGRSRRACSPRPMPERRRRLEAWQAAPFPGLPRLRLSWGSRPEPARTHPHPHLSPQASTGAGCSGACRPPPFSSPAARRSWSAPGTAGGARPPPPPRPPCGPSPRVGVDLLLPRTPLPLSTDSSSPTTTKTTHPPPYPLLPAATTASPPPLLGT